MIQYQPIDIPINAWIIQTKEEADNILLHGGKIIIISEDIPDYLKSPQYGTSCLMANCLLPDYEAVSYYIDNDYQTFANVHVNLLSSPESTIYFITMISAMINNIPLGFVFGNEEIEQAATINLLNFFAVGYGIHLGHNFPYANEEPNSMGWMDRAYIPKNVTLLYQNNLLTAHEFLYVYPIDVAIDMNTLQKLVFELRPPLSDPTNIEIVTKYFNDFRQGLRQVNKVVIDPMVMT